MSRPHDDRVTCIEVLVRGRVADSIQSLIASRYSALTVSPGRSGDTTRIVGEMDQAAERALLALLWDTSHDVISMRTIPTHQS
jgi:hypothetical protein